MSTTTSSNGYAPLSMAELLNAAALDPPPGVTPHFTTHSDEQIGFMGMVVVGKFVFKAGAGVHQWNL
ncbi:hypothetical protein HYALB_00013283 [Hymenoscyphus albidus]|uniref:Uncharacterized protein n=1 Tax=Hymenoscyphus albidus TaxID=595503 RepID=A0A9N9LYY1_9HELO|nr:hypothetical protein HYALB_00013283 [Hymenoscyphus albidus]